ncbi:MAG: hypothetical protein HYU86_07255 [Chloroflexi bacterium]|nr:hypothetical protein [Chloroflexota bacterium]
MMYKVTEEGIRRNIVAAKEKIKKAQEAGQPNGKLEERTARLEEALKKSKAITKGAKLRQLTDTKELRPGKLYFSTGPQKPDDFRDDSASS